MRNFRKRVLTGFLGCIGNLTIGRGAIGLFGYGAMWLLGFLVGCVEKGLLRWGNEDSWKESEQARHKCAMRGRVLIGGDGRCRLEISSLQVRLTLSRRFINVKHV